MSTITWNTEVNAPSCPGEILAEDGQSVLVQTDYDYPGVASSFGWSLRQVQRCPECRDVLTVDPDCKAFACPQCDHLIGRCCDHRGTDGTVDCRECGVPAISFITAAGDWLSDNDGAQAEDPGYFA